MSILNLFKVGALAVVAAFAFLYGLSGLNSVEPGEK